MNPDHNARLDSSVEVQRGLAVDGWFSFCAECGGRIRKGTTPTSKWAHCDEFGRYLSR